MKRASTIAAALVLAWVATAGAQEAAEAEEATEATEAVEEEAAEEAGSPTFVGGVTLTTEYVLRGISQTNEEAAVQGGVDLTEVMIASQKASVSFQAMTQVRNKLVQAYQDIMQMPV